MTKREAEQMQNFFNEMDEQGNGNIRWVFSRIVFFTMLGLAFLIVAAIWIAIDNVTGRIGELPQFDLSDPDYLSPAEMAWEPEPWTGLPERGADPQFVYGPPGDPADVGPMSEDITPAQRVLYEAIIAGAGQDA